MRKGEIRKEFKVVALARCGTRYVYRIPSLHARPMFSIETEQLPQLRPVPVRSISIAIGLVALLAIAAMCYRATDGFRRGTLRELSTVDRAVIERIEAAGIRVQEQAASAFGPPMIIVKVNWQPSNQQYVVTALSLENASFEVLLPFIRELSGLRELRAPYLIESELTTVRRQLPGITVNRRRT